MALTLKRLVQMLQEEGATDDEAEEVIASFMERRRERQSGLARVGREEISPTHTPMLGPNQRAVDYGDETAAEAKERWIRQEAADPQGIFQGGQSAGGIFGSGPIATDTYDPAAMRRTVDMHHAAQSAEVQHRTLTVLERVLERLGGPEEPEQLGPAMRPRKQLGRRRK